MWTVRPWSAGAARDVRRPAGLPRVGAERARTTSRAGQRSGRPWGSMIRPRAAPLSQRERNAGPARWQHRDGRHTGSTRELPASRTAAPAGLPASLLQETPQLTRAGRVAQLAERFHFDLADPLAGDVELLADLLERPSAAVNQPVAELEDPPLTSVQ